MNINIKTKNVELTPAIKEWVDEKIGSLNKFVSRYEKEGQILCEVELSRTSKHHNKGDVYQAQINMQLPDKLLRAAIEQSDLRTAIDMARDMLHRDLMKYKSIVARSGMAARRVARASQKAIGKLMWWRNK